MRSTRRSTVPLYIGGFLGPFGGGVVAVLVPQLRDAFEASTAGVAATIPAYLVPFAALQLVGGTIGERLAHPLGAAHPGRGARAEPRRLHRHPRPAGLRQRVPDA